ncbi:MAG: transporter [Nitrospiria bacterium]
MSIEDLMNLDVFSVNVLGTHTHLEDEWMLGVQYMTMSMDGHLSGTRKLNDNDVLPDFMVTPTEMTTHMSMIELMHGVSDDLTLMVMVPYLSKSMDHLTRTGMRFKTESQGIGDLKLSGHYTLFGNIQRDAFHALPWGPHRFILNFSISIPTGSTDEEDLTPNGRQKLPYPMQLGSGTYDPSLGITYLGQSELWAWAAEAAATLRIGRNNNDYRLGNAVHLSGWVSRKLSESTSLFLELEGHAKGNIKGADPDLNPAMVPTADPKRRGGERLDLSTGINLYLPSDEVNKGHRITIEAAIPIYESLDGPQLRMAWMFRLGWTWTY